MFTLKKEFFSALAILIITVLKAQEPKIVLPEGHTFNIRSIQFNKDATKVITASSDRSVKIWDVRSGLLLRSLESHTGYVNTVSFSPDEKYILTASNDGTAILWESVSGKIIHILKGHENLVLSAAFSPDGEKIMTSSWDNTVKIWNTQSGELLLTLNGHNASITSAGFSPDGYNVITSSDDSTVKVWNTTTGQLVYTIADQPGKKEFAMYSPDRSLILTAGEVGTVTIHNANTGKLIHSLKEKFTGSAKAVFSADGKLVASSVYNIVSVWDTRSGKLIHRITGHSGNVKSLFFTPDGKKLITSAEDSSTKIWSIATGKQIYSFPIFSSQVDLSVMNKNGKYIATGCSNGDISIYETPSGRLHVKLMGHSSVVRNARFSIDGKSIFTASNNLLVNKWSHVDGKMLSSFPVQDEIHMLITSKQNKYLATTNYNRFQIWNPFSGKLLHSLKNDYEIKAMVFSDNDEYIAACSYKEISVWEASSGNKLHCFKDEFYFVYNADFSPDGNYLVAACGDSTARVWEVKSGQMIHTLKPHNGIVQDALFSSDGRFIITRCYDNIVRVWNSITGSLSYSLQHNSSLEDLQLSPSGKYFLTSSSDSIIRLWETANGNLIDTFIAGNRYASRAAFSLNEKLAIVNADNSIGENQSTVSILHLNDKTVISSFITDKNSFFSDLNTADLYQLRTSGSKTQLYNLKSGKKIYEFLALGKTDYFGIADGGFYQCSPNASKLLHYVTKDLKIISFEQLDVKYNRPDKVLEAIGNTDTALIKSYRKAWEKRIKKLGIDTTQFRDGYSVPECDFADRDKIEYEQKNGKLSLRVKGIDSTYKLDRFNVWVNETPLYGQRGISIKKKNSNTLDTTITILLSQGENRIETSITNVNGTESYRMPLYVNYTPAVKQKEMTRFIGIGIDQFQQSNYNLQYSSKDIRDLAVKLKEKYKDNIIIDTLFNENVTTEKVKALKQKLQQTTVNDKVIISYSGHGLLSKDYDYYLSTYAVNFSQPEDNGLPYDELESLLDSIPARKKLLLIDACHSGEVDKEEGIAMNKTADSLGLSKGIIIDQPQQQQHVGLKNSFELMQSLFVNVGKSTGATIISAAAGNQFALERGDLKNGVFTYSLLEAMNQYPTIRISELKKIVGERVEQLTNGMQKPTSRNETIAVDWSLW